MFKRLTTFVCIAALALGMSACAAPLHTQGKTYQPYGVFTQNTADPNVRYEASVGDVILGVLFFETIVIPLYIFGFDVMQPVEAKAPEAR